MIKKSVVLISLFVFTLSLPGGVAVGESESEHDHSSHERLISTPHLDDNESGDDSHHTHQEDDGHKRPGQVQWNTGLLNEHGVRLEKAGPGEIAVGINLPGKIVSYEPYVAHIIPRFPGVIRQARKHLGESVKKGEVLAVIESNQSLNSYEVRSPISGVVVKRHSTVGEYASVTNDIFVVADLSKVWGEFYLFPNDFGKVEVGAPISIQVEPLRLPIESTVSFVSRVVDEHTQSIFIRAILSNSDGVLYPGSFADALVSLTTRSAGVIVEKSALQRVKGSDVVFIRKGGGFETRTVVTGAQDGKYIEIISGIDGGEPYAAGNTFIIKADIEKSEAEHSH